MKKRYTQSLIDADMDMTHYEDKLKETLYDYHRDLVKLIATYDKNEAGSMMLYKSVTDKFSKCVSLNRTVIDISMDIARESLTTAFEKSGIVFDTGDK